MNKTINHSNKTARSKLSTREQHPENRKSKLTWKTAKRILIFENKYFSGIIRRFHIAYLRKDIAGTE